ncbi:MAG: SapC family protein [Alphaproteobacteria bacterium]|nr:SapC family protein [Alphaproteobacteria bacterium]
MSTAATQAKGASQAYPLFYKKPEVLRADKHKNLSLNPEVSYEFARGANSLPINAAEMPRAVRHYPIVFTDTTNPFPVAVVGLRGGDNLFVEKDGKWAKGVYSPAYVRRYPFVFMRNPNAKTLTLCIDRESSRVADNRDNPFFVDGKRTDVTNNALKFCEAFEQEYRKTEEIAKLLVEMQLLTSNRGTFTLESGEKVSLTGFKLVDEKKFNDLPNAEFLKLREEGALPVIYCQLISMHSWQNLIAREALKIAAPKKK